MTLLETTNPAAAGGRGEPWISFDTDPGRYRHWKLAFDGPVATLALDTAEDGGLHPGYALKLNSYDLGVDIELHDAVQRLRFEHPEVRAVILTSAKDGVFCAGAEHPVLGAGQDDGAHLGVLEAQPLHGVVQLDVDAEVVGVQLEGVTGVQAAVLRGVQRQGRHRAVDRQLPVAVATRIGV